MAKHDVYFQVPSAEIKNKDVVIKIWRDGAVHGDVKISRGGIEWRPKGKSKNSIHIGWARFDDLMKAEAQG